MNAAALASALGGHRSGAGWMARCPSHEDREPSLSICERGGVLLIHCHAGCRQTDVIAELRARGLWAGAGNKPTPARVLEGEPAPDSDQRERFRRDRAQALWAEAEPAVGTLVETYLRSRGIRLSPPPSLRFHPALRHPAGGSFPTMLAPVTRGSDERPLGVHRTFLADDGLGKAPVSPQRMMLGPCRGGAVVLGEAGPSLMIGEGIETCLSAMQATGLPAWAALSASGLRSVELSDEVTDLVVLADGDEPGEAAARACAARLQRRARSVRIAYPPPGMDFNDLLLAPPGGESPPSRSPQ